MKTSSNNQAGPPKTDSSNKTPGNPLTTNTSQQTCQKLHSKLIRETYINEHVFGLANLSNQKKKEYEKFKAMFHYIFKWILFCFRDKDKKKYDYDPNKKKPQSFSKISREQNSPTDDSSQEKPSGSSSQRNHDYPQVDNDPTRVDPKNTNRQNETSPGNKNREPELKKEQAKKNDPKIHRITDLVTNQLPSNNLQRDSTQNNQYQTSTYQVTARLTPVYFVPKGLRNIGNSCYM